MGRMRCTQLTVIIGLAGCAHAGAEAAAGSADAEQSPEQASAELREHHRHHHHGGITQFVAMSLDTLGADEAKRPQIEAIQRDLRTCMAPARDADKTLLSVLADGVAAGTIDKARVDATVEQLETAAAAVHECSAAALNQLHALLSPEERAALVDKVRAHYEVWRQVNHEAEPGGQEKGGRLADLAAELNLAPDQVTQISATLGERFRGAGHPVFDPAKAENHQKAFESAFASDKFEAKTITANANGHVASHGAKRMAMFYATVTPLLTADQRQLLADHLRQRATYEPSANKGGQL